MSDTPRTDSYLQNAEITCADDMAIHAAAFARELECENAALREQLAERDAEIAALVYQQTLFKADNERLTAELAAEREMVNRLQIAVDGAAGLLTYAAYGADRCCNRPCSEVEGMVRRSTQMRAWVLKYGKWKMGIAYPETEAEISISIDAARRK